MKTRTILLSAAAIAALNLSTASFLYSQQDPARTSGSDTSGNTNAAAASDQNSSSAAGQSAARSSRMGMAGMSDVAQADRDQIDRTLAQVVKDAVQPGKFNDLVNCLSRQDRDRIQAQKPDTAQLDQTTKQLADAWKTKFGQDFDISDEKQAFSPFMIMSGESAEARTAGATMGPGDNAAGSSTYGGTSSSGSNAGASAGISGTGASAGVSGGTSSGTGASAGISGGTSSGTGAGGTASVTGDTSGTNGAGTAGSSGLSSNQNQTGQAQQASAQEGQRAHIMVPASHGLPEVTVNLVKEGGDWKIDIPDSIDANQLSQNLQSQLSQAQTMQSRWPSDQGRAQAALAHHVLLALQGRTSSAMGTGAGTGADNTGAAGSNSNYGTGASGTSGAGSTSGTGSNNTGR